MRAHELAAFLLGCPDVEVVYDSLDGTVDKVALCYEIDEGDVVPCDELDVQGDVDLEKVVVLR